MNTITLSEGKYVVREKPNGSLEALRHGEPWRDLTGGGLVFSMFHRLLELERERDQLQRWKEEMLFVWKKWEAVEAVVRKHPDTILGQSTSDTVLQFIKERDELSWVPVTERMPTEDDINEHGDVEWSDGKEVWEGLYSRNDKGATHWRRIVLP